MFLLPLLACTSPKDATTDDTALTDTGSPTGDTSETGDTSDSNDTGDTAGNGTPWPDETLDALRTQLKLDLRRANAFNAQVAIWYQGDVVWTEAFGPRVDGGDEEVTTDTLFQIGSDTKKMQAVALRQAIEAGRLTLDTTVAAAIPGFTLQQSPEWAGATTLGDLISHQGGLYDYTPWDDAPTDAELHDRAFGAVASGEWAMAPAGAMWNYSNPNFALAGLAVETADGRAWADILEEDLFAPLGLTRTFARQSEVLADGDYGSSFGVYDFTADPLDIFAPATYEYGETTIDGVVDNGFTRPAGLVWSTAADQARFYGWFIEGGGGVLSDEGRAAITSPIVPIYPSYPGQSYGNGWFVYPGFNLGSDYYDVPLLSHGGNTLTYTSTTYALPDQDWAISILTNGYGDDFSGTVASALTLTGGLPAPATAPTGEWATEADHAAYLGTYTDVGFGDFTITEEDGVLVATFPYLQSLGLAYQADMSFALRDVYVFTLASTGTVDLTFIKNDAGDYAWARARSFVGERSSTATVTPGRLTRSQIEALRLDLAPNAPKPWSSL